MNIKLRVANLVRRHGTANPIWIAEDLGIKIVPFDLPDPMRGFLVRCLRRKYILYNETLSEAAIRVVVAHEVGHARLHSEYGYHLQPNMTYYVPCKREREANEYAGHLLSYSHDIDGDLIARIINDKRPDPKVIHRLLAEMINC